jgi:cobalt-zinc-cadmium efflux system membrane fusion protein
MTQLLPLFRAVLIAMLCMVGSATAHEGQDHADQTKSVAQVGATPRLGAASGPFELVAVLQKSELVIYLDSFETNAAITAAEITVETPGGPVIAAAKAGTYRLAAPWAQAGSHDLIFTVTADGQTEILSGTLSVAPGSPETGNRGGWSFLPPALAQGLKTILGSGGTALVALIAFATGLIAAIFLRQGRKASLALAVSGMLLLASGFAQAHDGPDRSAEGGTPPTSEIAQRLSDGTLFVPKPTQRILAIRTALTQAATHRKTLELPGRIIPDPNASGFVQASVSGRLSPPTGGFPKLGTIVKVGDVLALVTPPFQAIDVSDMRQKAGELDQQINIVEKRIARYESLAKTGAVARVTLDEAVLELKGLRERRAAIDKSRGESERLIAPVSGIIAAANAVSGQITETNAVVFQIIDPARLWVEALTFSLLPDAQPATARTGDGRKLTLAFQGAGLTDRSQAIPVHFAIEGDTKRLRVGELVTVLAPTGEETQGLAVPRTAVLRGANGQTILFEHTAAERFEPRIVRVEPLDADRLLVLDGFAAGKRVVVQGPELLNQIR